MLSSKDRLSKNYPQLSYGCKVPLKGVLSDSIGWFNCVFFSIPPHRSCVGKLQKISILPTRRYSTKLRCVFKIIPTLFFPNPVICKNRKIDEIDNCISVEYAVSWSIVRDFELLHFQRQPPLRQQLFQRQLLLRQRLFQQRLFQR